MRCYRGVIIVINGKRRQALIDRSDMDVDALRLHLSLFTVDGKPVHTEGLPSLDMWKRTGTMNFPIWEFQHDATATQFTRISAFHL